MLVAITLDESEQALLLANEHNDHPGWQSIAASIRAGSADTFTRLDAGRQCTDGRQSAG